MSAPAHIRAAFEGGARRKTILGRFHNGQRLQIPPLSERAAPDVSWMPSENEGLWICRFRRTPRTKILAKVECGYIGGVRICRLTDDRRGLEMAPVGDN